MKKTSLLLLLLTITWVTIAQIPLTVLPSGGNKKAVVGEQVGLTTITIHYDRPGVKGREGKIWGQLVPVGFTDGNFGTARKAPWRAGANENTTIEFNTAVKIEGQSVAPGKYGLFLAYDPVAPMLILSKNSSSWGSYYYDEKEDALRVNIKPVATDKSVEWLSYSFSNQTENSATVTLAWEKMAFPFKIEVDYINDQINSFRKELRSEKGFIWQSWQQAADWCLQRNVNLEEALLWSDSASGPSFGGDKEFSTFATKAQLLEKTGKTAEATEVMKKALPIGTMMDIHRYARSLLQQKRNKEALEVFLMNFKKYPTEFTTQLGLVRGYSATGDYATALRYAQKALPLAPDDTNKKNLTEMIDKLKAGKDAN